MAYFDLIMLLLFLLDPTPHLERARGPLVYTVRTISRLLGVPTIGGGGGHRGGVGGPGEGRIGS
jgi:hypothetical protein